VENLKLTTNHTKAGNIRRAEQRREEEEHDGDGDYVPEEQGDGEEGGDECDDEEAWEPASE
jgi:hypothetical protein